MKKHFHSIILFDYSYLFRIFVQLIIIEELISQKISFEKWRKKLSYEKIQIINRTLGSI